MKLYIGVDLGTSAVKLLLMDELGEIKNVVSKEYPLEFPQPGWSQQNPEDWAKALYEGLPKLLADVDAACVRGIGAGGQMHGFVKQIVANAACGIARDLGGHTVCRNTADHGQRGTDDHQHAPKYDFGDTGLRYYIVQNMAQYVGQSQLDHGGEHLDRQSQGHDGVKGT